MDSHEKTLERLVTFQDLVEYVERRIAERSSEPSVKDEEEKSSRTFDFAIRSIPVLCIGGCLTAVVGIVVQKRTLMNLGGLIFMSGKSNTGYRKIPMQPNLIAWLEPYVRPRGPVCVVANLSNALKRIADRAGVEWQRNALRNSFISYRCAVTQNDAQVAKEAGNSVREIQDSYLRPMTAAKGEEWFAIMPTKSEVLPLFANAAGK